MLSNYLKIALRAVLRQKLHTSVNIFGLALGIAAVFVIGLYMHQELTYERGFENNDRIYRVATDFYGLGGFAKSQSGLVDHLPAATSAIDLATRFNSISDPLLIRIGENQYEEERHLVIDSSFFDMFSFSFIEGNRLDAMHRPNEIIISQNLASRYFGEEPALGKTLLVGEHEEVYQVSGVVKAPDYNTHIQSDLWLPLGDVDPSQMSWTYASLYNYFRVLPGYDEEAIEQGLNHLLRTEIHPASGADGSFEEWASGAFAVQFWVQPLNDIYLQSKYNLELMPGGNPSQVYILGIIAAFILLIAAFNYVNLTTAASSMRVKEIGLKRSMGVERGMLIQQFLLESLVLSVAAMVVAAGLAEGLLAVFEFVTGAELVDSIATDYRYIGALLGCSICVGLFAGIYPAFYLSGIKPTQLLKGGGSGTSQAIVRKGLVVAQFTIAIILIAGTAVIHNQLVFMKNVDKGLDAQGVFVVDNMAALGEQGPVFNAQLQQISGVTSSSMARRIPTGGSMSVGFYQTPEMNEAISLERFRADEHYLETMGMQILEGRNFSGSYASDSSSVILNESAVKALGINGNPIGQRINEDLYVIGVVSDFNFHSLRSKIEPVIMQYHAEGFRLAIKLNGAGIANSIEDINILWEALGAEDAMSYYFLDENFAALLAQEESLGRAISLFTVMAILIACLGLFGLTTYTIQRRTKEIGVRKILGATVTQIVALLSVDFLKLVGIATLIATPVAYLSMQSWLQGFAYRIDLGVGTFLLAGLLAASLAFFTLAFHAIKASLVNPVEAVRYE